MENKDIDQVIAYLDGVDLINILNREDGRPMTLKVNAKKVIGDIDRLQGELAKLKVEEKKDNGESEETKNE